jgi:hypothetical protein
MTIIRGCLLSLLSSLWLGCAGDEPLSPGEAATDVAIALCDWIDECGQWEFECGEDGCTASQVAITEAECVADRQLDDFEDVECGDLASDQVALVDDCIDGLVARDCVTQAEIDAYLDALESGEDVEEPGSEIPDACLELDAVFVDCLGGQ